MRRRHRVGGLIDVGTGPSFALLMHTQVHVGIHEPRQNPAAIGIDDLMVHGMLHGCPELRDAPLGDHQGAGEGFRGDGHHMRIDDYIVSLSNHMRTVARVRREQADENATHSGLHLRRSVAGAGD